MEVQGTNGFQYMTGTLRSQGALSKANQQLAKLLQQLSTAKRINNAADDAAGLSVAEQLTTQVRGYKQASQNIADATSALDIAEGAGGEITDMLQRQRELALAAKNGTLSADDRKALDTEYQAVGQEIGRVSDVTNYNRQELTNGTGLGSGNAKIQVGANAGDMLNIPKIDYGPVATGLQGTSIATPEGADTALSKVDDALNSVASQRTTIGATMNRLASAGNNLSVAMTNTQAAESLISDEDMAQGLTELTRDQLLQEGALKTFGRYNEVAQNHIIGLLQ